MHSRMDSKMFYVAEIQTEAPHDFRRSFKSWSMGTLEKLQIPFERVDTDEAITMEDCVAIDEKAEYEHGKNPVPLQQAADRVLFVCHRWQQAVSL